MEIQTWNSADLWKVLQLVREHILVYIYASSSDLAARIQQELPGLFDYVLYQLVSHFLDRQNNGRD